MQILIIEDDKAMVVSLGAMLAEKEYKNCCYAASYAESIGLLRSQTFDLALIDICLGANNDGILLASAIHHQYHFPFVFTTSLSDPETLAKARETFPSGYLVKPFDANDLAASVEIAMHNFRFSQSGKKMEGMEPFFVKMDYGMIKIDPAGILFFNGEGNYIKVHLTDKKPLLLRSTIKEFLGRLPASAFMQVHKSYVVHLQKIETISGNCIIMNEHQIPISTMFREELIKKLGC